MFFSKRAFNALSSSSCCPGDKSLFLLSVVRARVAVIVLASLVACPLLRFASVGLSVHSYQLAASTQFGVRPSVHPCSPLPGEYGCVPSFPSRRESAGRFRALPPQMPPAAPG